MRFVTFHPPMIVAPHNVSEFCCRTRPCTNPRRYQTYLAAYADSSNSLLESEGCIMLSIIH